MVRTFGAQRAVGATILHCDNINIFQSRQETILFSQAYDGP